MFIWRRQWHSTPVLLPGKSHGWRSLEGCSPGVAEGWTRLSDFTFTFSLSCIGEGTCTPLQRSCLENPRDGGAWWAAVHGVAKSWTRLKRLGSSSSSRCLSSSEVSFLFLVRCEFYHLWTSLVAQMVKNLPAVEDIQI